MVVVGHQIWPPAELSVVTPRLTLRYISDELAVELAHLAAAGIHDPAMQPFSEPWTDVPSPQLEQNTLRYFWKCRAETTAEHWDLCLGVVVEGKPAGVCTLHGDDFPTRRSATTGSWLGRGFQGQGLGREIRQAALHLLFAGFGAERAVTRAWHDNAASVAVTRSLPYTQTATTQERRRDRLDTMIEFTMMAEQWNAIKRNDIQLNGVPAVREQLNIEVRPTPSGA